MPHSQSGVTAASATACLACTGILNDLQGLTSCHCDNIGLVLLILLGWELRVPYITVLCVQGIPILSLLIFMPIFPTFTCRLLCIACSSASSISKRILGLVLAPQEPLEVLQP